MTFKHLLTGIALTAIISLSALGADDVDRTKPPAPKPAPKVMLPEIQKATLANGLKVWLVEQHELPTVAMNLIINAGSDHDPLTQPGLASITADVLDEGTTTRSSLQISEEIESIGASFATSSGWDGSFMTLNTLTKHLGKGLEIFADVLTNPTFPEKEFERLRKQRITSLMQQRDQPVMIANNAFSRILYGTAHPYGNNPAGNEAALKAISIGDLRKFYQTYYRPNNATLVVVGDVKMSQITSVLDKSLSAWKAGDVSPFTLPSPRQMEKMKIFLVDKPGAPQSEVRIGYPALARSTPDFFPVTVMNRMLGGQFTSRINLNLREKHGYTYGARSGFSFQKGAGPFTASGGIVTEKTDSALHEFLYEITLMRDKGMTPTELAYVKKGLVGSFALTFETPAQVAGALQNVVLYGLPDDYYQHYLQNIDAVSLDEVGRVSRKYLDASKMAVVVVGDLAKIRPGIEAMKIADIVVCDLDGTPVP
jgi:zinc protease